jgi:hypothetical protein
MARGLVAQPENTYSLSPLGGTRIGLFDKQIHQVDNHIHLNSTLQIEQDSLTLTVFLQRGETDLGTLVETRFRRVVIQRLSTRSRVLKSILRRVVLETNEREKTHHHTDAL